MQTRLLSQATAERDSAQHVARSVADEALQIAAKVRRTIR